MKTSALTPPVRTELPSQSDRITEVAREFESIFTSMMLKSMRKTIGEDSLFQTSMGEKIYTEMLDDKYSEMMGQNGNLGLASLIEKELRRLDDGQSVKSPEKTSTWMFDKNFISGNVHSQNPIDAKNYSKRMERWDTLISRVSERYGVDKNLVTAVIAQESAGNEFAVSKAGAKGLMQLMDTTAREMGAVSPYDPEQNIDAGVKYLRSLLDRYDGNEKLALASYNAGPGAVDKYKGVPPYRETIDYVASVQILRNQFGDNRQSPTVKE